MLLKLLVGSGVMSAALAGAGLSFVSSPQTGPPTAVAKSGDVTPDATLAQIADYKKWKLVNPTPAPMQPASLIACTMVMGLPEANPHTHKFISVYVNKIGESAMWTEKNPVFPVGSTIVKEKLATTKSTDPELLTVMIKREKGYNPSSGDWEYLLLDGPVTKIMKRGKLEGCNSCHTGYKYSDYITRTYMRF